MVLAFPITGGFVFESTVFMSPFASLSLKLQCLSGTDRKTKDLLELLQRLLDAGCGPEYDRCSSQLQVPNASQEVRDPHVLVDVEPHCSDVITKSVWQNKNCITSLVTSLGLLFDALSVQRLPLALPDGDYELFELVEAHESVRVSIEVSAETSTF